MSHSTTLSAIMSKAEFDPIETVAEWLEACRTQQMEDLLDSYDASATLACACEGKAVHGWTELERYWWPKLAGPTTDAFVINDVVADGDSIFLDYQSFDGKPVRIRSRFTESGKIKQMSCGPIGRSN